MSFETNDLEEKSNPILKERNQPTQSTTTHQGSSLSRLFALKATEMKGPSPNKVYLFKYKNKK